MPLKLVQVAVTIIFDDDRSDDVEAIAVSTYVDTLVDIAR